MILDSQLIFSGSSLGSTAAGQAITTTAASTNVIDLLGVGSGVASTNRIGNATVFGEDLGIGDGVNIPRVGVWITQTFSGGTSLNVQFQGAIDNGSNAPGTWTTYDETGALLTAILTTSSSTPESGVIRMSWPHRALNAAMPRFIRLNYVVVGTYSLGAVAAGIVLGRDDWAAGLYASGFSVA